VLRCHQEQGAEAVTEEVVEGTEMVAGQDMAGTGQDLDHQEEDTLVARAEAQGAVEEAFHTSDLAVEASLNQNA